MKTLFCLLLLFTNNVFACTLNWTVPTEGLPVEAYRLYINSDPAIDVGNVNTWDCTGRTGSVIVRAYNATGEAPDSNIINFMIPPGRSELSIQY